MCDMHVCQHVSIVGTLNKQGYLKPRYLKLCGHPAAGAVQLLRSALARSFHSPNMFWQVMAHCSFLINPWLPLAVCTSVTLSITRSMD